MHLEGEVVVISLNGNFERFKTIEVIEKVEQRIGCQRCNIIIVLNGIQSIDNYGVEALVSSMFYVHGEGMGWESHFSRYSQTNKRFPSI